MNVWFCYLAGSGVVLGIIRLDLVGVVILKVVVCDLYIW